MFSQAFPSLDADVRKILGQLACPSPERTAEILDAARKQPPSLAEIAELLEIGARENAGQQFGLLRRHAGERFRLPAGNRVRYIAPVYVSNFCVDSCGYCNFSAARKSTARKRLDLAEYENEVAGLIAARARVIELVFGTDAELSWRDLGRYVAKTVDMLKGEPGSGVFLCSDYLPAEAYRALHGEGLAGMVQWDETLDRESYVRWHGASPRKRHFEARMDSHCLAMAAGLEAASGALLGLADFRYETLMQVAKARFLAAEHGRRPFVFGTARLTPIDGRLPNAKAAISDHAYETALTVYKIAEPAVGRWLQTRETFDLNLRNVLDGDAFTARCGEVRPGGYTAGQPSIGAQFAVHELFGDTAEARLNEIGFRIDYAWVAGGKN